MAFLKRLLGRREDRASGGEVTIASVALDAFGTVWEVERSPSGRFTVQYRDVSDDDRIGYRLQGAGRWRLMEGDRVRADGRLERPNEVVVADNGTFVIADWLLTDDLAGRFYAFDSSGAILVEESFAANILQTYLAPDGSYAAVACASNPERPDFDERFTVYDLTARRRLWFKALEVGRATRVEFRPDLDEVRIASENFGPAAYRLSDGWVDTAALRDQLLRTGDGFVILRVVGEEVASGPVGREHAPSLVAACDRAAASLAGYPAHAAKAHRMSGEILLGIGDETAALRRWRAALELDPGVGIKRRADALAEKLAER